MTAAVVAAVMMEMIQTQKMAQKKMIQLLEMIHLTKMMLA
jgi:hypothetical protein